MCLPCNSCSRASFGPPESTVQTASRSVQSFLHRSWQPFPICTMGAPFPQNCPFSWVICNTWLLGPIRAHNPNIILIDSSIFAQFTAECPYTLQWAASSPSKLLLPMWDVGPHLIHCPLSRPKSSTLTAHLDHFSRFCRAHYCDRPTDRQTTLHGR